MPYMTQTLRSGTLPAKTYYKRQTNPHVTHEESRAFTQAARQNYATFNHIAEEQVEVGPYQSGQGVPQGATFELT